MYKIYKYTNKINNKVYIGQTSKSLEERAGSNGIGYYECRYFWNAIKKYGWDNFEVKILKDSLTSEQADKYEKYYIQKYNSTNRFNGYNIKLGGNNTPMSEESKCIISEKAKERYKDKTKNPMYGRKHSTEALKKMSQIKLGKNNPMYGKHLTEEHRFKISQANKGKITRKTPISEKERKAMSERAKERAKSWAKKVKCITDGLCFNSIVEAAKYYGVSSATLSGHLNGRQKSCANRQFVFVG